MVGNDYNVALFVFFVPYILCEVPSNLVLKKVAPSTWLSAIMFAWGMTRRVIYKKRSLVLMLYQGVITVCQGVTQSFGGLVACRFLLGIFEAGFVPGLSAYQSLGLVLF